MGIGSDRRRGIRVRGWLAMVAVVALALGTVGIARRRAFCLERASYHRRMMVANRGMLAFVPVEPGREDALARSDVHAAWHLRLAREYERAADRPWGPPPIEPTEPDVHRLHHILGGFDTR